MRTFGYLMILATALVATSCVDDADPSDKTGTSADPVDVVLASDAKADGSPYAIFQGNIELDERHTAWLPKRTAYHTWTFEAPAGSELFIDVPSRDGDDTYLMLYREVGGFWTYVAGNDDCYDGTLNACFDFTADGGRYLVLATTYSYAALHRKASANYEIAVACNGGTCADQPQACGSRGLGPCPDGQFCEWAADAGCGTWDAPGTCQDIPDVCPLNVAPVCGCDGQTYSNLCAASLQGVSTAHDGQCDRPGQGQGETCGGIAGLQCEGGLKCDYSANTACNISDVAGVCVLDELTFCTSEYAPVCACDGRTYSNECQRIASGVALDHVGECTN